MGKVIASSDWSPETSVSQRIEKIQNGFLKHTSVSADHPTKGYQHHSTTTFHRKNPVTGQMKAQLAKLHAKLKGRKNRTGPMKGKGY